MAETVIFERRGPLASLRLNRPAKLNAQTPQMWEELRALGRELRDDTTIRCLVVSGEGRAFSSGIDLAALTAGDALAGAATIEASADEDPLVGMIRTGQEAFSWLLDAPFPSVAAVRGYALGAGLQLALACDLRIAARGTQLRALEFRYGLLPDLGGTAWLPRLVGPAKAKELVFTAARVDADEALRIGLVNRVVDDAELDATVGALADTLAAQPPLALRHAKRAIDAFPDAERSLQLAAIGQAACLRSEDFVEAGKAFLEGRPAVYRGR
jgi:enoyl-CoA hydratase/carnithine racemase